MEYEMSSRIIRFSESVVKQENLTFFTEIGEPGVTDLGVPL